MKIQNINLKVIISPKQESLSISGNIQLNKPVKQLFVYLNKSLNWKEIYVPYDDKRKQVEVLEIDNDHDFFKKAKKYKLELPNGILTQQIFFEYSGGIVIDDWGTNYIKPSAIELALYANWYPIHKLDDRPNYTIEITSPTANWEWKANGKKISDFKWKSTNNPSDITLLGLPNNECKETKLFWGRHDDYESTFKFLENDLIDRKRALEKWLGSSNLSNFTFAFMPRKSGGIYVRGNLLVTQHNYPDEYDAKNLLFSWTHELAHLWFSKASADTWHNWVDEALAEYTALLLSKEKIGNQFFESSLEKRRLYIKNHDLPPIFELHRGSKYAQACFYIWGSLILDKIKNDIGLESFKLFLHRIAQYEQTHDMITTNDFIEVLTAVDDQDWEDKLYSLLKVKPALQLL